MWGSMRPGDYRVRADGMAVAHAMSFAAAVRPSY